MANKEIERKIAVIFATDVVGYSKSVEVNEEQTIKNFRSCKKIIMNNFSSVRSKVFMNDYIKVLQLMGMPDQ